MSDEMQRTVLHPEIGQDMPELHGAAVSSPVYSAGMIIDTGDCRLLYCSGRLATDDGALDPADRQKMVGEGDIKEQTRQVLRNLQRLVGEAGGTMEDVVRVRVYVPAPMTQEMFGMIHEARSEFFAADNYPASTLVVVTALVRDSALIEIDADVVIPRPGDLHTPPEQPTEKRCGLECDQSVAG
jgi:enamine deaminase RidA (YjgF/YER057c/UK114 family)